MKMAKRSSEEFQEVSVVSCEYLSDSFSFALLSSDAVSLCFRLRSPVESPPYRKSIRGHTNLFSAHDQTRALNITFDPSPCRPKNRYILGNAWAIPMQLISGLCGK